MERSRAILATAALIVVAASIIFIRLRSTTDDDCGCKEKDEQTSASIEENERMAYMKSRYAPQSLEEVAAERLAYIDAHGNFNGLGQNTAAPRPPVGRWNTIGPYGMIQTTDEHFDYSGKALAIAQHFDISNILYLGASNGGVWKSTDAGTTWFSVFDSLSSPCVTTISASSSVGDSLVWIGTGARPGEDARIPMGLLFWSSNTGRTWNRATGFPNTQPYIAKVVVDFWHSNIVYVGTTLGFYISTNGGGTWAKNLNGDVCDIAVYSDLLDPTKAIVNVGVERLNGASNGGLYRSTDGGSTFTPTALPGLASDFVGKISLTNGLYHSVLYASVSNASGDLAGIWQSVDRGVTWKKKTNPFTGGGQGFRNNSIAVDPNDALRVLVGWNIRGIFVTTDGGESWTTGSPVHEDIQQIAFSRNDSKTVYHVSDAGVFKSTDFGVNWGNAGGRYLPLAEIYHVTPSLTDPQGEWIGTQDDGVNGGHNDLLGWENLTCCDGGDVLFQGEYVYVNVTGLSNTSQYRWQRRKITAKNDTWEPFTQGLPSGSPGLFPPAQIEFNGTTFYTRLADTVYVTTGTSLPWHALGKSPRSDNTIIPWIFPTPNGYVFAGYVPNVNPEIRIYNPVADAWYSPAGGNPLPTNRGVTGFSGYQVGSQNIVFATFTGTSGGRIFRSSDNGMTWTNITNDLPGLVNLTCVLADKFNPNVLYVGSDFGVFGSANQGQNWVNISDGLPAVPVVNALSQRFNGELLAATFGRGVYAAPRGVPLSVGGGNDLPLRFALDQNYPNPFNPLTTIQFTVPERTHVVLRVFDVTGRSVETLQDGDLDPGHHTVRWNGARYASGTYFCRLEAGEFNQTRKMMLLR